MKTKEQLLELSSKSSEEITSYFANLSEIEQKKLLLGLYNYHYIIPEYSKIVIAISSIILQKYYDFLTHHLPLNFDIFQHIVHTFPNVKINFLLQHSKFTIEQANKYFIQIMETKNYDLLPGFFKNNIIDENIMLQHITTLINLENIFLKTNKSIFYNIQKNNGFTPKIVDLYHKDIGVTYLYNNEYYLKNFLGYVCKIYHPSTILKHNTYSDETIEKLIAHLKRNKNTWVYISMLHSISIAFGEKYKNKIIWDMVSTHNNKISESSAIYFEELLDLNEIVKNNKYSPHFIRSYLHKLKINNIFLFQPLDEEMILSLYPKLTTPQNIFYNPNIILPETIKNSLKDRMILINEKTFKFFINNEWNIEQTWDYLLSQSQ